MGISSDDKYKSPTKLKTHVMIDFNCPFLLLLLLSSHNKGRIYHWLVFSKWLDIKQKAFIRAPLSIPGLVATINPLLTINLLILFMPLHMWLIISIILVMVHVMWRFSTSYYLSTNNLLFLFILSFFDLFISLLKFSKALKGIWCNTNKSKFPFHLSQLLDQDQQLLPSLSFL